MQSILDELANLRSQNEQLQKQVNTLASTGAVEAAKDETPKIPTDTFTVGKKKYKFAVPKFIMPGKGEFTALEALTDNGILAQLVKSGSEVIVEVVAE